MYLTPHPHQSHHKPTHRGLANSMITYNLDGIAAGKYTLVTTLRDKNSDKSGSFRSDIEITE